MGEIMIRGYCVMLGYWADQDKTNECITESGWYKTGWVEAELQTQHNKKNIKKFTQEKKIYTSTGNLLNAAADVSRRDIGSMDAYGYCKIDGRIKDMIIRGGENIYPAEIEQFLHTHPKIKEAQVSSDSER